jgi:LVIVD repeat
MRQIQQTLRLTTVTLTTFAVLGAGLAVQPVLAKGHSENVGYTLAGQTALPHAKATDLFLRQDKQGHKYLYVVYADMLTVLNVTNPSEVSEMYSLAVTANKQTAHDEPVNARFVVLTNTTEPEQDLAVVDTSAPAMPKIAKEFKNAECYTIDSSDETLYVVRHSELSIMRFDHPVSRDAEIFEQSYEAR